MTPAGSRPALFPLAWVIAAAVVALQVWTAGRYGIFRDELYYLMCADHLAWGYVDHPPLAMVILAGWKGLFGESVLALRTVPALLNGAVALGGALLVREMRGGRAAQALAAVTAGLTPGVLALSGFYSMNAFDVFFWVAAAWMFCRLADPAADRRWWWALGLTVGLGLLNKYSMAFLGVGLAIGILLSPLRGEIRSRNFLIAAGLAGLLCLPHLVWQIRGGFPSLEFIRNAGDIKNAGLAPHQFWGEQLLMAHPGFLPVWLTGLLCLLLLPRLRPWRPLGVAFVVVGVWLSLQSAKPYYLVPAYPMVMAAGAVALTEWLARWRRVARVTVIALPVMLAVEGLIIAPLTIPIVPANDYLAYEQRLGLRPKNMENNVVGDLPQHFADRFGWRELAGTVSDVVSSLPAAEQARTLVVTGNYGECGAINHWGLPAGVPAAVSGHNSCFTWWPEDFVPEVVVMVGGPRERMESMFESVERAAVHDHPLAMPYEQNLPIWIGRGWKVDPVEARRRARFAI